VDLSLNYHIGLIDMESESYHAESNYKFKYKVLFFAGGETRDNKFNIFTASFIRLMKKIMEDDFDFIRGIYFKSAMMNVIWALNHAQKPVAEPEKIKIYLTALAQILESGLSNETQLVIISSSSGSVVAAQTACYLAKINRDRTYFSRPFHLVLGSSMISTHSELYKQLKRHQSEGNIGVILQDEMKDEHDTAYGVGGKTKMEAYRNALGLMFPFLSARFKGPSFLNTHPLKGHIHRKRSQTVQKAIDYINIILIKNSLAGEHYREIAQKTLENKSSELSL